MFSDKPRTFPAGLSDSSLVTEHAFGVDESLLVSFPPYVGEMTLSCKEREEPLRLHQNVIRRARLPLYGEP